MVGLYINVMLPGRGLVGNLGLLLHFVPVGPQPKNVLFGPCVRQEMPIRLLVPSTTKGGSGGKGRLLNSIDGSDGISDSISAVYRVPANGDLIG